MKVYHLFYCLIFTCFFSCQKEWEQPPIYTVNLSLPFTADSVDADNIYYLSDGMKLQIVLVVDANGETIRNMVWKNFDNFHFGDSLKNVTIKSSVISRADTSFHIADYPVIMTVYKDGDLLYQNENNENSYSL